jgi:hypothetical protein
MKKAQKRRTILEWGQALKHDFKLEGPLKHGRIFEQFDSSYNDRGHIDVFMTIQEHKEQMLETGTPNVILEAY